MRRLLPGRDGAPAADCACEPEFDGDRLVLTADGCPGRGRLAVAAHCRATAIDALADAEADAVSTRCRGRERAYLDDAAALLVAAGRFADRVRFHDERLAERSLTDPLSAAREATGRAGPVADVAAESGLAEGAERVGGYDEALRPYVGPTLGHSLVRLEPPLEARLRESRETDTGATVRTYERPGDRLDEYHVTPTEATFDADATETLATAAELLADGSVGGERAAHRAVRRVATPGDPVERLGRVLEKHTAGLGVLRDLFADPAVSDAFVTAPATETRVRVRVDGDLARTNVRLTGRGAGALASQFRLRSGRAFSRASPTLDATVDVGDRRVRVAGATDPVSDGVAFAFRAHERERWTLRRLVENGTLPPAAAALLSVAGRRAAATLLAGTRGAGKTTLLGALLWELSPSVRTVVIEDTPELPVDALRDDGRDVQHLLASSGDGPGLTAAEALRTALRLGEGALVVGEVRGEEAAVLYEAMRVGASGSAVLGTVHGDGGEGVRERVVSDLDVPESSFATTDLVATLEPYEGSGGERRRRVKRIEEVVAGDEGVRFAPLFALDDGALTPTGRIDRGNSRLVASLAGGDESYATVRSALGERERTLRDRTGVDAEPIWSPAAERK